MKKFMLRVYGLVVNKNQELLISDELVYETTMTKFPGGELEFGEGLIDGLKREFKEECNGQEIENIRHFYTTDFFQKALFVEHTQLISIYYLVDLKLPLKFKISTKAFDFNSINEIKQSFRWVKIKDLKKEEITFPIDKFVASKLKTSINEQNFK